MAWTEGERGCKSPDECRAMTQNQGTYVPRSPEDFLKSTPLVGATGVLYAPRSADGMMSHGVCTSLRLMSDHGSSSLQNSSRIADSVNDAVSRASSASR